MVDALGLSKKLGSELLILALEPEEAKLSQLWIRQVSRVQKESGSEVPVIWIQRNSDLDQIISVIREKNPSLIILDRRLILSVLGNNTSKGDQKNWRDLITQLEVPLLIMSTNHSVLNSQSVLVPMSGEVRVSKALEWSIRFANRVELPLDLIHVTREASQQPDQVLDFSLLGRGCDEFHHEYPSLVAEFLAQASPYSSLRERRVIRRFSHCSGRELAEILRFGEALSQPILVVEWKGNLGRGRSQVVRGVLQCSDWPIVLLRENH